jgi:hypothetical protein
MTATHRIDVVPHVPAADPHLANDAALIGLGHLTDLRRSRYYLVADPGQPIRDTRAPGYRAT